MHDAADRVTGRLTFVSDMKLPGMLYCRLVRSTVAHAEIVDVDIEAASRVPFVRAVLTGTELASKSGFNIHFGPVLADQPVLAHSVTRYVGEPIAAVVAESPYAAEQAAALVSVQYQEFPPVFDAVEACAGEARALFETEPARDPAFVDIALRSDFPRNICNTFSVIRGDVDRAFAEADYVFDDWYESPAAGAAPLETHAVLAESRGSRTTVWTNTQTPHIVRRQLALMLETPLNSVRVIVPPVGGGFGSKAYAAIEPIAVIMSRLTDAPVLLSLGRDEEFLTMTKHAMKVRLRTAVNRDGKLLGREATAYYNAGAYATISPRKVMFAGYGLNGPYSVEHVRIEAHAVLTNTPPAGAYRGFAINQAAWAYENQMDAIGIALGLDPVELRRRNLLRSGDLFCTGERLEELHFHELLDAVSQKIGWNPEETATRDGDIVRAKGMSVIIEGTITPSTSTGAVRVEEDGSVVVLTSSVEMGQGIRPALAKVVAEHLGVSEDRVRVSTVDTDLTSYDQQTTASRSVFSMGEALHRASDDLIDKLRGLAGELCEVGMDDVIFADGCLSVSGVPGSELTISDVVRRQRQGGVVGEGTFVTSGGLDPFTGQGVGSAHWHQSVGAAEVSVDLQTGRVSLERYVGGVYAGRVIDDVGARHQCEGCLVFGVGNALFEELLFDQGQLTNGSLADYMVPTVEDMPGQHEFILLEGPEGTLPHGLGEPALPPVAPAISNAVFRATGVRLKSLPMSAEKVLRGLHGLDGADPVDQPQPRPPHE